LEKASNEKAPFNGLVTFLWRAAAETSINSKKYQAGGARL
jgi:hypothetical protein